MRGGRDREVERGGRGRALSPRLAEALHSEEKRPARRLREAEGWARVESRGGPQLGLGGLEGGGGGSSGPWASLRSGCTSSDSTSSSTSFSGAPERVQWTSAPEAYLLGRGGPSLELLQAPSSFPGTRSGHSPPSSVPSTLSSLSVSGVCRWEGRARASTSLLLLATGFCSTRAPECLHFLWSWPPPTQPGVCAVVEIALTQGK